MDPSTASDYFGQMAQSYDALIRRAVPRYDEMTERLVDYLPERAQRIVELGCGTGILSLALARRYPDAELVLVDAAPEMVETTRSRLGPRPRARFIIGRFEELSLEAGAFDVVTSSISLHHVEDKPLLFVALARALAPGGRLAFADQLRGAGENHAHNWRRWLEHCRVACSEEETRSLLDHARAHDHYDTLADHFAWLTSVGLRDVDCVWRNGIWGIVTATRV